MGKLILDGADKLYFDIFIKSNVVSRVDVVSINYIAKYNDLSVLLIPLFTKMKLKMRELDSETVTIRTDFTLILRLRKAI